MNRNRRLNYRFVAVLLLTHGPILRSAEPAPNLLIEINSRLVEPIAQMPVDRTENVRDYILKTDIFGIGHTVGRTRVEFVPCEACALFDVILEARTDSQTVGYRGPVRLHNANQSDIVACKRVCFDRDGIRSEPALSYNHTTSNLEDIDTRFRCRILDSAVRRAAHKRYERDKERARQISEEHVDQRVQAGFDRDVQQQTAAGNQSYSEKLRKPLEKRGLFPEQVTTRTSATTLFISARLTDPKAGPIHAPPTADAKSDLSIRVHESLLNVGSERILAGTTYTESRLREEYPGLFGHPKKMPANDSDEMALTFTRDRPVEYRFDNNLVTTTIRITKFVTEQFGEQGGLEISTTYRLQTTAEGIVAIRQGLIGITLSDSIKGKSTRAGLKALLANHLKDILAERLEIEKLDDLFDEYKIDGSYAPTQFQTTRGWLIVGVRRVK